jgi:hypothetical protein
LHDQVALFESKISENLTDKVEEPTAFIEDRQEFFMLISTEIVLPDCTNKVLVQLQFHLKSAMNSIQPREEIKWA